MTVPYRSTVNCTVHRRVTSLIVAKFLATCADQREAVVRGGKGAEEVRGHDKRHAGRGEAVPQCL